MLRIIRNSHEAGEVVVLWRFRGLRCAGPELGRKEQHRDVRLLAYVYMGRGDHLVTDMATRRYVDTPKHRNTDIRALGDTWRHLGAEYLRVRREATDQ